MTMMERFSPRRVLKSIRAKASVELCARWPILSLIWRARRYNDILLSCESLKIIIDTVKKKAPCRFLIFGLWNDSTLWSKVNRYGKTVFLEDNESWMRDVLKRNSLLTAYLVKYCTLRTEWSSYLESPEKLHMNLPDEIEREKWDVILVDGPNGHDDSSPGRMKSIFLAWKLSSDTDIFVDDCDRMIEQIYCDRFLKDENLKAKVDELRHYHLPASSKESY